MAQPPTILIIGAGIGGLALACAGEALGLSCEIYERAPALLPVGAGILLHPSALRALQRIGLAAAVIARGNPIDIGSVSTLQGKNLQSTNLARVREKTGFPTLALHRAALHEALHGALRRTRVQLGHRLVNFQQDDAGVIARFENGRSVHGSLLVAADGLHSYVRGSLYGPTPPRYAGYTSFRGVTEQTPAFLGAHAVTEIFGRGQRFGVAPLGAGQTYWFAVENRPEAEPDAQPKRTLLEYFRAWPEHVQDLIRSTPAERVFRTDVHDRVPLREWSRDRVTLLGDAAHPTTPNLGQGGCMAIEDAVVLAHCLTHSQNHAEAFMKYEALRVTQTTRIVQASRRFGAVAQARGAFAVALRNGLIRCVPGSIVEQQLLKSAEFVLDTALATRVESGHQP